MNIARILTLILLPFIMNVAQEINDETKIKIIKKTVDGVTKIDTTIEGSYDLDIEGFLEEFDFDFDELHDVNIEIEEDGNRTIIKKIIPGQMNLEEFDFDRFHEFQMEDPKPRLGIALDLDKEESQQGVRIIDVFEGSGASKASILKYDVLWTIDQTAIFNYANIGEILEKFNAGDMIPVEIIRDGTLMSLSVPYQIIDRPMNSSNHPNKPFLGIMMTQDNGKVMIENVVEGSGASKAGIPNDSELLEINGTSINTTEDVRNSLQDAKIGDVVSVKILNNNNETNHNVTLSAKKPHHSYRNFDCREFNPSISCGPQGHKQFKKYCHDGSAHSNKKIVIHIDEEEDGIEVVKEIIIIDKEGLRVQDNLEVDPSVQDYYKGNGKIMDQQYFNEIEIYPNPVVDHLNVNVKTEKKGEFTLTLFSVDGKVIEQVNSNGSKKSFQYQFTLNQNETGLIYLGIEQNGNFVIEPIILR